MRESIQDRELSELGTEPDDVRAIVRRTLGERPISLAYADELLEALTQGRSRSTDLAEVSAAATQSIASLPFAAVSPRDESPPVFAQAPSPVSGTPLFNSRPPPLPSAAPLFDSRSVPAASAPESVFDAREESGASDPESEATAQAIEAAFGDSEPAPECVTQPDSPHDTLPSTPAVAVQTPAASSLELSSARTTRRGSRRPDLDRLLTPALDVLEFARDEPRTTPSPATTAASSDPAPEVLGASRAKTSSAPDDFEILVDDEILEIAEDDMEMIVDDDNAK